MKPTEVIIQEWKEKYHATLMYSDRDANNNDLSWSNEKYLYCEFDCKDGLRRSTGVEVSILALKNKEFMRVIFDKIEKVIKQYQ